MAVNLPIELKRMIELHATGACSTDDLRAAVERWGVDSFYKGKAAEREEQYRQKLRNTVTP